MNTTESALEVLDHCLSRGARTWFDFEKMIQRNQNVKDTLLGKNLHRNIRTRIAMLQQKFRVIEDDLKQTTTKADEMLRSFLLKDKAATEANLQEFHRDLTDFGEVDYSDDEEIPENSKDRSDSNDDESIEVDILDAGGETLHEANLEGEGKGVNGVDVDKDVLSGYYGDEAVELEPASDVRNDLISSTLSDKPIRKRQRVLRRVKRLLCMPVV